MSGLRTARRTPADILITPLTFGHDHGGVKKTSTVQASRPLGGDLKLGLLIKRHQRIPLLQFTNAGSPAPIRCTEVTSDVRWSGVLAALQRFMAPAGDEKWVLFEMPEVVSGFTSEFVLAPPPTPPAYQNVSVVAVHAAPNDPEPTGTAYLRLGAYGYASIWVPPAADPWATPDGP